MAQRLSEIFEAALVKVSEFFQQLDLPTVAFPAEWGADEIFAELRNWSQLFAASDSAAWHTITEIYSAASKQVGSLVSAAIRNPEAVYFHPVFWSICAALILWLLLKCPHPFKGPRFRRRDTRRG